MAKKKKKDVLLVDGETRDLIDVRVDDRMVKEQVYRVVQAGVLKLTGGEITPDRAKDLVEAILEMILFGAVRTGYLRLPRGFGSFHLKGPSAPFRRVLPDGREISVEARPSLKYTEGLAIRDLLLKPSKYEKRKKKRVSAVRELLGGTGEKKIREQLLGRTDQKMLA